MQRPQQTDIDSLQQTPVSGARRCVGRGRVQLRRELIDPAVGFGEPLPGFGDPLVAVAKVENLLNSAYRAVRGGEIVRVRQCRQPLHHRVVELYQCLEPRRRDLHVRLTHRGAQLVEPGKHLVDPLDRFHLRGHAHCRSFAFRLDPLDHQPQLAGIDGGAQLGKGIEAAIRRASTNAWYVTWRRVEGQLPLYRWTFGEWRRRYRGAVAAGRAPGWSVQSIVRSTAILQRRRFRIGDRRR
ncbi:hypothetical protein ACWEKR_27645 [Nocardia sp. NPDC004573]